MSESKFETVSMLVDSYQLDENRLAKLNRDEQLSDTWEHYHLIGDVMRGEVPEQINLDIANQVAQALAKEPTILAPQSKPALGERLKAKVVPLVKPFGQVAIAASAAALMIMGVQQTNVADNQTVPQQVIQTTPFMGVANPVSLDVQPNRAERAAQQQAYIEQQRRFQALLSDHQQQLRLNKTEKSETNKPNQ